MKARYILGVLATSLAVASDYSDTWGPPAGSEIPAGSFTSHDGETRAFVDLTGSNGLLILFNRSANW